jgi:methylated-DNA-[protein]-cysteine S-methyltransferase
VPGAYDLIGSLTGAGGRKIPWLLTATIVKSNGVQAEHTRYVVPEWGEGELWTSGGVVLASEFDYGRDGARPARSESAAAAGLVERIRSFLAGEHVTLADVELDLSALTPFEQAVVQTLRAIPRGEVVTYGELAALAGYPGAHRAAGSVCARNQFAFFVPCHRVVAAGGIGSYGSVGVAVKRRLLALEGVTIP